MGILDIAAPGQSGSQGMGGILGGGMQQAQAPQGQGGGQDTQMAIQLASKLSQNPTLQTAQQIVAQLHQMQIEGADQIAQIIQQIGDDPQALKQVADAVIQQMSGGGQGIGGGQ